MRYLYCRINQTNDFAADYHLYRLEWLKTGIQYFIDDELVGEIYPPTPGGFWQLGQFQGDNIWSSGTLLAPFDQTVIYL